MTTDPVAELRGVTKHYRVRGRGTVHALDEVDLVVRPGQVLGLVGESGCGKSTVAQLLVGLVRATGGQVLVGGRDLRTASRHELRRARRLIQLVFQDPYSSLDPRQRVGDAVAEVLTAHRLVESQRALPAAVGELLERVGLPAATASRYPHQLSGGQRQRIGIARALAVRPRAIVLDEPVSALDVSVRAEIINLLLRLREELGLGYVFISHDLATIRHICDEVAVMYLGRIVEAGPWNTVSDAPLHPYTQALHAAVPPARFVLRAECVPMAVPGEVADAARLPAGCRFHPRCPLAESECRQLEPALLDVADPHHVAGPHRLACHVRHRPG
jgi:oligopeptide transport system ATP-binding protein